MRQGPSPERVYVLREVRELIVAKREGTGAHSEVRAHFDELLSELDELIELSENACAAVGRMIR